jgi:predicted Rossmann-fold nucleotide-binding protein
MHWPGKWAAYSAKSDMMVITGGGAGIMAAAHMKVQAWPIICSLNTCRSNNGQPHHQWHAQCSVCFTLSLPANCFFTKEADALVMCLAFHADEVLEVLTFDADRQTPLVLRFCWMCQAVRFWQGSAGLHSQPAGSISTFSAPTTEVDAPVHSAEEALTEINQFYSTSIQAAV